jgi:hypothetical protein
VGANSVYLVAIRLLEWSRNQTYQNYFYQLMFLAHLVLGLLIVLPVIVFGVLHFKNAHNRPTGGRSGRYGLFLSALSFCFPESHSRAWTSDQRSEYPLDLLLGQRYHTPAGRLALCAAPAGGSQKSNGTSAWAGLPPWVIVVAMAILHSQDPRKWNVAGRRRRKYFHPSLGEDRFGQFHSSRR